MLLACAREHLDDIVFFTLTNPDAQGALDCEIARKLAKRFGLNQMVLPFEEPSTAELDEWLYRTGGCIAGPTWRHVRALRRLDPRRAVLKGQGGELGRSFHWRHGDTESSLISAKDLLIKRDIPTTDQIMNRAQQWLETLPVKNALTIWGLLYTEQFNGCALGPKEYGYVSGALRLWPFCHRRILETMMSLPAEYRLGKMLPTDLIGSQWPELLRLPFNWPVGIKKYFHAVKWRVNSIRRRSAPAGQ